MIIIATIGWLVMVWVILLIVNNLLYDENDPNACTPISKKSHKKERKRKQILKNYEDMFGE